MIARLRALLDHGRPVVLVVLAALALVAWAFASPIGSSPDDDYHLTSAWCASATAPELCADGAEPDTRLAPEALDDIACYAYDSEESAACQEDALAAGTALAETGRGNFRGEYPPVFYAVAGLWAGGDVQVSALLMRLTDIVLCLGLIAATALLVPAPYRRAAVWGWLVSTVPLGLFLLASNNPSSWAIAGVGTAWLALVGFAESTGGRRMALGALFAVAVLMAAGSRGDAAVYSGLAIVVAVVLVARRDRRMLPLVALPAAMAVVAIAFFLGSRQVSSGVTGFGGSEGAEISGVALLAYNVLNLPALWAGLLDRAGLGWLDVPMPAVVALGVVVAFAIVAAAGLGVLSRRKGLTLALVGLALVVVPLYVLQAGGDSVGQQVQPRYLLPLGVMFAGLLLLPARDRAVTVPRVPALLVGLILAGANFVALHLTIRRYVTGLDVAGLDLGTGAEWWWDGPIGPNAVWLLGSAAFALLVLLALPILTGGDAASASRAADPRWPDAAGRRGAARHAAGAAAGSTDG